MLEGGGDVEGGSFPFSLTVCSLSLSLSLSIKVLSHPLPTSGTLTTKSRIAELWDKEKAALVVIEVVTTPPHCIRLSWLTQLFPLFFFSSSSCSVLLLFPRLLPPLWLMGAPMQSTTSDHSGRPVFLNRMSAFIRGIGGWGGERGPKPETYAPPARTAGECWSSGVCVHHRCSVVFCAP
jgi:hypothetical protein